MVNAIAQAREKATLTRLLVGLGMPKIGEVWAHEVAVRFGDLKTLMETPPADIFAALVELHGFGDERARAVSDFFADERHRAVLQKLMARGVSPSEPKTLREGPLAGVRVCVTGTLSRAALRHPSGDRGGRRYLRQERQEGHRLPGRRRRRRRHQAQGRAEERRESH